MGSADRSPHGDDDVDGRRSEPRPVPEYDGAEVDLAPVHTGGRTRPADTDTGDERARTEI